MLRDKLPSLSERRIECIGSESSVIAGSDGLRIIDGSATVKESLWYILEVGE